jgi:hypothetical protein
VRHRIGKNSTFTGMFVFCFKFLAPIPKKVTLLLSLCFSILLGLEGIGKSRVLQCRWSRCESGFEQIFLFYPSSCRQSSSNFFPLVSNFSPSFVLPTQAVSTPPNKLGSRRPFWTVCVSSMFPPLVKCCLHPHFLFLPPPPPWTPYLGSVGPIQSRFGEARQTWGPENTPYQPPTFFPTAPSLQTASFPRLKMKCFIEESKKKGCPFFF